MEAATLISLVTRAGQGDRAAMEELYNLSVKKVYYLALKILRDPDDATELTREVFRTVYEKIGTLKQPGAYYRWLNLIACRKCFHALKAKHPLPETDAEPEGMVQAEIGPLSAPAQSVDDAATGQTVLQMIDELPDGQRVCVMYYCYGQLTAAQIAEVTGLNENIIKSRLTLAQADIRARLATQEHIKGIEPHSFASILTRTLHQALHEFVMPQAEINEIWREVSRVTAAHAGAVMPPLNTEVHIHRETDMQVIPPATNVLPVPPVTGTLPIPPVNGIPPVPPMIGPSPGQHGAAPPPPPPVRLGAQLEERPGDLRGVGGYNPPPVPVAARPKHRRQMVCAVAVLFGVALLGGGAWAFLYGPLSGLLPIGIPGGGAVSKEFHAEVESLSAAVDETLAALSGEQSGSDDSEVIAALYGTVLELEQQGVIKNITTNEVGIFFDYAEGVPGGIVMETALYADEANPEVNAAVSPAALATDGSFATDIAFGAKAAVRSPDPISLALESDRLPVTAPARLLTDTRIFSPESGSTMLTVPTAGRASAIALASDSGLNLTGNKKVYFGESISMRNPSTYQYYTDIAYRMETSGIKDLTVTVDRNVTLSDLESLYDYGAIFLNIPYGWSLNGEPWVLLNEKFVPGEDYGAYPNTVRGVGVYSLVSPEDPVIEAGYEAIGANRNYYHKNLFGVQFDTYFFTADDANQFPNSYIHLNINNGMAQDTLSNVLLSRGAGCVSGYSAITNPVRQDHEIVSLIADYLIKPYVDGHGCPVDYIELTSKSLTVTQYDFARRYYADSVTWKLKTLTGTSRFLMKYKQGDLRLWAKEPEPEIPPGELPYLVGDPSSEAQSYMVGIIEAYFEKDAAKIAGEYDYETFSKQKVHTFLDAPPTTYDQQLGQWQTNINENVDAAGSLLHIVFGESKEDSFTQNESDEAFDADGYVTYPGIDFDIFAVTENGCFWFYGLYITDSGKLRHLSAFSNVESNLYPFGDDTRLDAQKLVEAAGYTWPYTDPSGVSGGLDGTYVQDGNSSSNFNFQSDGTCYYFHGGMQVDFFYEVADSEIIFHSQRDDLQGMYASTAELFEERGAVINEDGSITSSGITYIKE